MAGAVSMESGIIAALISLLMVTYLAAWLWLPEDSAAGRVNWWLHTLALLVFLPLIPQTKHLHLMLSPVTIFFRRGGFSQIPPLEGDEDFGIETGKDVTQLVALQAFSCVECGRCTEHCPANNTGKLLDPKKIVSGRAAVSARDHGAERNGADRWASICPRKMLWQCTSCGACEYQCPVGIQHLPIIIGLRRGAVNTGKWEDEYGEKLFLTRWRGTAIRWASRFERTGEVHREECAARVRRHAGVLPVARLHGRVRSAAAGRSSWRWSKVLNFLGVTWGVLKKERCTGDPVRRLGNDLLVANLAEFNRGAAEGRRRR